MGGLVSFVERVGEMVRLDGWENVVLGLGGAKDPSAYTTMIARPPLDDMLLEALYVEDHFAGKIIEARPQWALRPGWSLDVPGSPSESADVVDAYRVREEELDVAAEIAQGACWGRVFGGAVTWIGADDRRDHDLPLDESKVRAVEWLHTFDRRDVQPATYYRDPKHPKFRKPETYIIRPRVLGVGPQVVAGGVYVHETRLLVWPGQPTTDTRRAELRGWDDSILERCWDPLRQAGEDHGAKSLTLGRISQPIFKIKDLFKMIAGGQRAILEERMALLDRSRSRARAILLDPDEDFLNVAQPVSGIAELIDKGTLRLAAAADMPVTILMGQSPAGMDATGESDLESWAATVDAWRDLVIRPRHERLAKLILLSLGNEPESWRVKYGPVREPTRKESAEIGKLEAETDALNIDKGVYSADIAAFRYGPGGRVQLEKEELDRRLERRKKLEANPPKDNAELGTIAPRTAALLDVITRCSSGTLSRESARAILIEVHHYPDDVAEKLLGPAPLAPPPAPPSTPGPAPAPQSGQGAGAPQPIGSAT